MKPDWNRRFAAGLLAILLCLCSFSMPAFASGSDPAPEPLPEIIEEEPTTGGVEPEGVPITPKGNAIPVSYTHLTSNVAVFVPFVTQELFQSGAAMYYGINAKSHNCLLYTSKWNRLSIIETYPQIKGLTY